MDRCQGVRKYRHQWMWHQAGEREALSCCKITALYRQNPKFTISTSKSFWAECKTIPPRQQRVSATLKKNVTLPPHKHFVNLACHGKARPRSWLSWPSPIVWEFLYLLPCWKGSCLGVWPDLKRKIIFFLSYFILSGVLGKKNPHNVKSL